MKGENRETKYNSSGSSRQRRLLPMLDPGYFKIDDRTVADFLVFIEKYADQVYSHQIINPDSTKLTSETWKPFFYSDISIFLAKLSSIDQNELLPFYLKEEWATGYESHRMILQTKLNSIMNFISFITDSYHSILNIHGEEPKLKLLVGQIEQIRANGYLKEIFRLTPLLGLNIPDDVLSHKHFKIIWGDHTFSAGRTEDKEAFKNTVEDLNRSMNNFFSIAGSMVYYSREMFWDSVNNNQRHTPGTALFIAFLKLYNFAQNDLNNITGKHLDYFYRDLLQQKIKPSEPDHVHVCFSLADHADACVVEKGTLFKAGIDEEGFERLYAADDFLTINKTKITDLCSIYLSQKEEVGIESSYEFISNIYQSEIYTSKAGGFDFSLNPISFSPFETNRSDSDFKTMKVSEVGFAIASPVLLLSEGKREIDLVMSFDLKSMSTLLTFLERYTINENLTFDKAFHKLFSRAFNIFLSASDGWYEVEDYRLFSPDAGSGSFRISLLLPMGAPAITCMGEEWDPEEVELYDTEWPVLKLCLTDQKSMFVYSYLKDLIISECCIEVSVSGIKNFEVFNDLGKLDTSNPFYPFGSLPVLGSSLLIGNEELYKKNIEDFSLELGWYNLPRTKGGFKTYYQEYGTNIDNDSFKVGITALSDFEFHPTSAEKVQKFSLFSVVEEQEGQLPVLAPVTTLKGFDIKSLNINPDYSQAALLPYSNKAKSGYIKLELLSPEMGFGQDIYPSLFSSRIIKGLKTAQVDLPNPPYAPQLKSITLNYKAASRINFQTSSFVKSDPKANEKVILLQPFGIQTIFKNNTHWSRNFLPKYTHNGYLLLGLDQVFPNEPLTIYFILDPSIGNEFEVELPLVEWFYVSNDKWVAFEKKDLIFDTTRSFTTTGIVKLLMPKTIDNQNTALPKNKYWIVAAIKGDMRLVAKLKGIYTQSLKLTWTPHKEGVQWSSPISENTIEHFVDTRTEVASVFQPLPSFGGRDEEKPMDYYTRISERLQHRNRCITAWDYERMVLEKFPYVNQVKCISPVDNQEYVKEGKVILVVVPKVRMADDLILPRFNYSVLQEIKEYVEAYTSPFVNVQVINPVYEEVKVTASIKFSDPNHQGTGVENLHRDLRDFICPWYADSSKEMQFSGSINLDDLESFMVTRPYISFVTRVSILVLHYHDKNYSISDSVLASLKDKTLYASKPWTVLIPMKQHLFTIIDTDAYISPGHAAIENLRLGNEFVLEEKGKEDEVKAKSAVKENVSRGYITIDIDL